MNPNAEYPYLPLDDAQAQFGDYPFTEWEETKDINHPELDVSEG